MYNILWSSGDNYGNSQNLRVRTTTKTTRCATLVNTRALFSSSPKQCSVKRRDHTSCGHSVHTVTTVHISVWRKRHSKRRRCPSISKTLRCGCPSVTSHGYPGFFPPSAVVWNLMFIIFLFYFCLSLSKRSKYQVPVPWSVSKCCLVYQRLNVRPCLVGDDKMAHEWSPTNSVLGLHNAS